MFKVKSVLSKSISLVVWGCIIVSRENLEPLSRGELTVLSILVNKQRDMSLEEIAEETSLPISSVASLVELLRERNIVDVYEHEMIYARTSEEGKNYIDKLPEEKLVEILSAHGSELEIKFVENMLGREIASVAIGWARKKGWINVDKDRGAVKLITFKPLTEHHNILKLFLDNREVSRELMENKVFDELVKRKLLILYKKKVKVVKLLISAEKAKEILSHGEGISRITRDVIVKDLWKIYAIKPYNLSALPPVKYTGKKHFFKEFINMIKEVMESLGFEEVGDDYIIPELWNFDILFQAQDHPSRDVHDILIIDGKADISQFRDIVDRVKEVHEKGGDIGSTGWGYIWLQEKASRLILRSHTTAVTARSLIGRKPPARLYAIARVFRRDNPDARHSPEFTNFDGVIMEQDFSFKKLLGLLTQILRKLEIEKIKFKPAYFPFTEPSVEGYGYVQDYGWIEIFGAGMFRPEVLRMLGVEYPVGAWGMGVERLAMIIYGIDDIRLLFSKDVEFVRRFPLLRASYVW